MKIRYTFILFFLLYYVCIEAQERQNYSLFGNQQPVRRVFNEQQSVPVYQRMQNKNAPRNLSGKIVEKKDTALFLSLTKRFGWYYGVGEQLSKSEAEKLPCYYRLTEKDTLDHYTHIEAINGMGLYTQDHELSTHLIGKGAQIISDYKTYWKQMLQSVVQLRLLPSSNGKYPSIVSGYDAIGNQIYTYILTQFNDSTIIGHYSDSFGEPVSLLPGNNVAKYVQVIVDTLGYERRILYLDENTYFKRNTDGAYMLKKDYDSHGNVIRAISCMMNGIPIKDDWGNCGWYALYNERGQILQKNYIDEEMNPIKMGRKIKTSVDVMSRHFEYEKNRLMREFYLTDKGEKDYTLEGVHCKEWEYDERGNVLCITTKDTINNLCNDRNHISQTFYTYTENGNLASTWFKNKDSLYVNDSEGICLYMGKNTYRTTTGRDTIPVFQEIVLGNTIKTIDYKGNLIHVVKNDTNGKEIESSYYNLDMKPKEHDGYYRRLSSYNKLPFKEIQEDIIYSFNDTIRSVTVTDTKEYTRLVQTYHDDILLSSYGQTLTKDLKEITGQYGYDALGNRARSHLENALYYKVNSGSTYRGVTSYMMGRNEYNEPSYVAASESLTSDIFCTKLYGANNTTILLDEFNREIEDVKSLRDSLNRVYCIEVLNKNAYKIGLRSGDVIVKYADFSYFYTTNENWKPRDELQMETYLTRNAPKQILVLRYIPQEKTHKVIPILLPKGTPSEIGFLIQTVYYTNRESQRFNHIINNYLDDNNIKIDNFKTDKSHYGSNIVCLLRPYKVKTSEMPSWRMGLQEDVLIVAVVNKMKDGSTTYVGIHDGFNRLWKQAVDDCDSTIVFFTSDGKTLKNITLPGTGSAVARSHYYMPTNEYNSLLKMEEAIPSIVKGDAKLEKSSLTPEQAYRFIDMKTDSIVCVHLLKGEEDFESGLKTLGSIIDVDLEGKSIESYYFLYISEKTNSDEAELTRTILKKIDFSNYESKFDEKFVLYYKVDTAAPQKVSELVIINESMLFVINGEFNYNNE